MASLYNAYFKGTEFKDELFKGASIEATVLSVGFSNKERFRLTITAPRNIGDSYEFHVYEDFGDSVNSVLYVESKVRTVVLTQFYRALEDALTSQMVTDKEKAEISNAYARLVYVQAMKFSMAARYYIGNQVGDKLVDLFDGSSFKDHPPTAHFVDAFSPAGRLSDGAMTMNTKGLKELAELVGLGATTEPDFLEKTIRTVHTVEGLGKAYDMFKRKFEADVFAAGFRTIGKFFDF